MDLTKYLTVMVVFCFGSGKTGGHEGDHHDHLRIHLPEFIHHDHHTKVITIHHHHQKPKKEHHHHHHHHHHKPIVPHHAHHHHKKFHIITKTISKNHGHHGHHSHHGHHGHHSHNGHHGHHGHHSHHGHHGHHGHHDHDHHGLEHHGIEQHVNTNHHIPTINSYTPPQKTFEEDFGSAFTPSVSSYGNAHSPHVQGISHTFKQVNVYDSQPGAIPTGNANNNHGYEVTENEEDDDDAFTSVNSLQQSYPGTYEFVRGVDGGNDPYAQLAHQGPVQTHSPFVPAAQPTSGLDNDVESFTGTGQHDVFLSSPTQSVGLPSAEPASDFPSAYPSEAGFDNEQTSFVGSTGDTALLSNDETNEETPVVFAREGGIQQLVKTGGVETVVY